jgi:ferredoxin
MKTLAINSINSIKSIRKLFLILFISLISFPAIALISEDVHIYIIDCLCDGCGTCEAISPESFIVSPITGKAVVLVGWTYDGVEEAQAACPYGAILTSW